MSFLGAYLQLRATHPGNASDPRPSSRSRFAPAAARARACLPCVAVLVRRELRAPVSPVWRSPKVSTEVKSPPIHERPIAPPPAVGIDLTTDRRWRTAKALGDRLQGPPSREPLVNSSRTASDRCRLLITRASDLGER
jgi:hypothetical protein